MSKRPATVPFEAPDNLVAGLAKSGTRKSSAAKQDDRTTIVLSDPKMIKEIGDMIRTGVIAKEIEPIAKQKKLSGTELLFKDWTKRFWDDQSLPDNPRYLIQKEDSTVVDMECLFQVKFRADGLTAPDLDELPPGTTVEKTIFDALVNVVGLTSENAAGLLNPITGEISISQEVNFVDSFNAMHTSDDDDVRMAATKVMTYLQAKKKKVSPEENKTIQSLRKKCNPEELQVFEALVVLRKSKVNLPSITPEELKAIVSVKQVIRLKEDFLSRAHLYCTSEEQLANLIRYTKMSILFSSPKFADSEKKADRVVRMQSALQEFLGVRTEAE